MADTEDPLDQKLPCLRDDEAEAALEPAADLTPLERIFGSRAANSLRSLATRVERSSARSEPLVLILPGVMGCRLGIPGRLKDDMVWLDPLDVRRGNLDMLAIAPDGTSQCETLGVMLLCYLSLKLWLQAHGFRVAFYPYDWRRGVVELGQDFARHLAERGEDDVRVVAHSYGGLVTRAALAEGARGVTRVVTLGTPHEGAYSTCMVLRGTHPVIQRVAALDHRHDHHGLVARTFRTFPSLYQLLPYPALRPTLEVFDPAAWPEDPREPIPALLARADAGRSALAPVDERFRCVAGYGHDTPLDVRLHGDQLAYPLGSAGDGIVPLASAAPPGAPAWYVEGAHGFLPGLPAVLRALPELLDVGDSDRLPRQPPVAREREGTDDGQLDAGFQGIVESLRRPSPATLRALITDFAAPVAPVG